MGKKTGVKSAQREMQRERSTYKKRLAIQAREKRTTNANFKVNQKIASTKKRKIEKKPLGRRVIRQREEDLKEERTGFLKSAFSFSMKPLLEGRLNHRLEAAREREGERKARQQLVKTLHVHG